MRREDFAPDQRRHVVRAEGGFLAFVPPPLPPDITLTPALIERLSAADRAIGELAGVGRTLPNPEILTAPIVRREAVLSSLIEGTRASYDQLALFEVDPPAGPAGDVQEVYNYVAALARVLDPDRRLPLSVPLLLEAHETLLTGVRGGYATPGELRRSPNWIGPPGCTLNDATYVPPPPERLWECLDPFEKFLHANHRLPPLVTIACLHYQLEAIQPFIDGNGRVGRLLIVLLLLEWGLLPGPLLDISAWIEPRRAAYYERLLRVSTHGDWLGWLSYFLTAVAEQARDAQHRATRLHAPSGGVPDPGHHATGVQPASAAGRRAVHGASHDHRPSPPRARRLPPGGISDRRSTGGGGPAHRDPPGGAYPPVCGQRDHRGGQQLSPAPNLSPCAGRCGRSGVRSSP